MSEQPRRPGAHASVFAKLVMIMVVMAAGLLLLVGGFFAAIVLPALNPSIERLVAEYVRLVAATQPDLDSARRLAERLDIQVRYEGPNGTWATEPGLPRIADVREQHDDHLLGGRAYYVASTTDGGRYLFVWTFRRKVSAAHDLMLVLLLALMIGVVITAYAVIRNVLRPLRSLGDGVARLSDGELDVVLPMPSRDEFGVLTEAFNTMVGRVREMIRARDQLLLDVSHELRSPLTRLRVALELMPEGRERARMTAEVVEMDMLVAELLELERLRDGRTIVASRHDLMPIIREVVESFQDRTPGVRLAGPSEVTLVIDREKIRAVVRNLLDNAFNYSLPDSHRVDVAVAADDDTVIIRVDDDGPGIPDGDLASVFEPFFRVNRSRSRTPAGYGLGLSICRRILDAHGGSIAVENRPVRGASFVVSLPRKASLNE